MGHELGLKSIIDYLINHDHATSYLWPLGHTHMHTYPHERDFIKPGVHQPAALLLAKSLKFNSFMLIFVIFNYV